MSLRARNAYICIYIYGYTYMREPIHWKFVFYRPVIRNVMQNYVESSSFSGIQDIIWYQVRVNPAPGAQRSDTMISRRKYRIVSTWQNRLHDGDYEIP